MLLTTVNYTFTNEMVPKKDMLTIFESFKKIGYYTFKEMNVGNFYTQIIKAGYVLLQ